MTYQEAEAYLYNLPRFAAVGEAAYAPGLGRIEAVLDAMGNPHCAYPTVHIAGTNGKGSTASFLAAIATEAGQKIGLHTSPHLLYAGERMRVDGEPASKDWLAGAVADNRHVFEEVGVSFFEATVALSFLYFAEQEVDLAVIEVGLGGRLDATNIVSPELAIITSIGLDHTHILGNSIRDIAREKAGIIKEGVPLITGAEQVEAMHAVGQIASERDAPVTVLDEAAVWETSLGSAGETVINVRTPKQDYNDVEIGLAGSHQARNAILAILAAEKLFPDLDDLPAYIRTGLKNVKQLTGLQGRMEIMQKEPLIVLDVGHNTEGLAAALTTMSSLLRYRQGQLYLVFGTMRDKDVYEMAILISDTEANVFAAPLVLKNTKAGKTEGEQQQSRLTVSNMETSRALPPEELKHILHSLGVTATCVSSLEAGLSRFYEEATNKDGLLITGSHYLVSQYYNLVVS